MIINKDTKIYGSFSNNPGNNGCIFFNNEFEKHNINAIYKSFYSTNAEEIIKSVKHLNFSGFALSMPLKIEIMKYLDDIDNSAKEIGAVNTVINKDGKLIGYNTDWIGVYKFITTSELWFNLNESVIILGDGGFSKAIQYSLKKLEIKYDIINRKNWDEIKNVKNSIVFNATPIDVILANNHLIDGRPFTEDGKKISILQAKEQFHIYTGIKI
jgi:shikimate dehydrogenase